MNPNAFLAEQVKFVAGLVSTTPNSTVPLYASMKGYTKLTAVITVINEAAGVTGSDITLHQATSRAGANEKELSFDMVLANLEAGSTDTLVETEVADDTFTTDATASAQAVYVLEVKDTDLDTNGGFDCVRVGTGDAAATVIGVTYILWPAKYGGAELPSAMSD
ncbi:hypothetical protein JWJ90_13600 [Desulfobulbus rhabdoformis]|uniref:hypothetical protein n=1 Tax=Desulfobulbus rhabdoformis TaxID=34032 RepID=UPI001966B59C|nr:hypothetical protein [Desulfobulbus rhabdoformis]MBM9615314.1 hypothetical protein [Desulfobulbus rhabdoformis]